LTFWLSARKVRFMTCICTQIPRDRAIEFWNAQNIRVHATHLDCPEHGIKVLYDRPMRQVLKQGYLTRDQLAGLRVLTPARVVQKHANGTHAMVEWVEWESMPVTEEEEQTHA
jgi:hypothetical protein